MQPVVMLISARKTTERITSRLDHFYRDAPDVGGPTLIMRDRIGSHGSADRMIAARFKAPMAVLDGRKRFVVRIEEVDGKTFEYTER